MLRLQNSIKDHASRLSYLVVSAEKPGVLVDEVRMLQKGQKCLNVVDYFLFIMALADKYE